MKKSKDTGLSVLDPFAITNLPEIDEELNNKINASVKEILKSDIRLSSEPEIISAIRDFIIVEIVKMRSFKQILSSGSDDSNTERLFRSCINAQSLLREEIWGSVRGRKTKEEFTDLVTDTLIKQKIIEPKVKQIGDRRKPTEEGNSVESGSESIP